MCVLSVADILGGGLNNGRFRRTLYRESLELWEHIREACGSVTLNEQRDVVRWTLMGNGKYTVKSCYRYMVQTGFRYPHNFLWKVKMTPRVKVFMWLTLRVSILSKDNLIRRRWSGDSKYSFCGREDDINHLFFRCSIARLLWMVMKCSFGMHDIPDNIQRLFLIWIRKFNKSDRDLPTIGIPAIFWTL